MSEDGRKDQLATLLTIIIENSTILPFRWNRSQFMCFYCQAFFVESAQLREHTFEHREIKIKDVIIRTLYKGGKTKLDISNLWCTSCPSQFDNFQEYFDHLSETHGLGMEKEVSKSFDCFQLDDDGMSCVECGQYFRFFGPLLAHTNKYHVEQVLCEICGQGFPDRHNVLNHVKVMHGIKSCKHCNETFRTQYALTNHVENVHRTDKLQCPMCPKILRNRYLKKRHLALVHDCKSAQFICEYCSKIFTRNNKYIQHKLRVHLKEKNCTCEVCGHKTFNEEGLKVHMVVHGEERPFKCATCEKAFRRKKNLVGHMKTHRNDKIKMHRNVVHVDNIDSLVLEVSE